MYIYIYDPYHILHVVRQGRFRRIEAHRLFGPGELSLRQALAALVPARRADGGCRVFPEGRVGFTASWGRNVIFWSWIH